MKWFNNLIGKLSKGFRRYMVLNKRIDEKVVVKSMIKSVFGSLLITLLIVIIPVLVVVNMFIYAKRTLFLAILLLVMVIGAVFLYFHFYYVLLKNYHPLLADVNYRIPQFVESIFISIVVLFIGIVIISVLL